MDDDKLFEQFEKDIKSGIYRNFYLVYNRKSTDEPNNQKNSIKYQNAENGRFFSREKLLIAQITLNGFCADGIISERHSAFKTDDEITFTDGGLVQYKVERPKFQRLMYYLSQGLFKGVICLCWDRLCRNQGDETIIRKLMKKGVDFRFALATYEKSSSGELHLDIDGMFAEHHSRVTREKVTITTRNLRASGVCTYRAPLGYLNLGDMYDKPFDPDRYKTIRDMFNLCATNNWTLSALARWANAQGLTSMPMRRRRTDEEMLAEVDDDEENKIPKITRPVSFTTVHKILTNKFYTGRVIDCDKNWVPSVSHQALVSDEIFAEVQEVLRKRRVSTHYSKTLERQYRGFVRCGECSRLFSPYIKKGILYFGAKCLNGCQNPMNHCNVDQLEEKIGKVISSLHFTDAELVEIEARLKTDLAVFEVRREKELEQIARQKKKIREDLDYLAQNKISLLRVGTYTPEDYLKEESKLNTALNRLHEKEQASDIAMREVMKDIVKLSELLKNTGSYYYSANSTEKEKIARIIFSELSLSGDTLKYKVTKGFKAFENRFSAICDPTRNRTAL